MCTVSFLPTADGFRLAMNRDEKRNRVSAQPPRLAIFGATRALLPREPNGGTWIAVNEVGICFALINWHTVEREPRAAVESRGLVVEALASVPRIAAVPPILRGLPLPSLRPFRLIAIAAAEKRVVAWHWDLRQLRRRECGWKLRHWFSSGFDEPQAELVRATVCAALRAAPDPAALRRLHRSHAPERGPFSICMHRADAATVSYTEVVVAPRKVMMRYQSGAPCAKRSATEKRLARL